MRTFFDLSFTTILDIAQQSYRLRVPSLPSLIVSFKVRPINMFCHWGRLFQSYSSISYNRICFMPQRLCLLTLWFWLCTSRSLSTVVPCLDIGVFYVGFVYWCCDLANGFWTTLSLLIALPATYALFSINFLLLSLHPSSNYSVDILSGFLLVSHLFRYIAHGTASFFLPV